MVSLGYENFIYSEDLSLLPLTGSPVFEPNVCTARMKGLGVVLSTVSATRIVKIRNTVKWVKENQKNVQSQTVVMMVYIRFVFPVGSL